MYYVRVVHGVGVIRFSLEHVLVQTLAGPILLLPSFQVPAHSIYTDALSQPRNINAQHLRRCVAVTKLEQTEPRKVWLRCCID